MALVRRPNRPFSPFFTHWPELDWFDTTANRLFSDRTGAWAPSVNVEETDSEILLTAELPGVTENDVDINIDNNVLTISGEKRSERETETGDEATGKYHLVERTYGSFSRAFTLPRTVDAETITADFENGVLAVRMPKSAEARSRKIAVKTKA